MERFIVNMSLAKHKYRDGIGPHVQNIDIIPY